MKKQTGAVQMMRLEEIFGRYAPAYGDTWEEARKELLESRFDRETIERLREELRTTGTFAEPIWLYEDPEDGALSIGNGMHRLTAAHLEGVEEVPVTPEPESFEGTAYAVEFTCSADDDDLYGAVRSFTIDGTWVECSVLGGTRGPSGTVHNGYWDWNGPVELLLEGITERLEGCGWTCEIRSWELVHYDDETPEEGASES